MTTDFRPERQPDRRVAIATPVHTHYELGLAALEAGKHVLIEKPLAQTSEEALDLIEEAVRRNLVLLVDHTFLYTPAVRKIRQLIGDGVLGDIYYYNGVRASLGLFQNDVNVIWDLAVHDISIINTFSTRTRLLYRRLRRAMFPEPGEHGAYHYSSAAPASLISVNWLSPVMCGKLSSAAAAR